MKDAIEIKEAVRRRYAGHVGGVAVASEPAAGNGAASCCAPAPGAPVAEAPAPLSSCGCGTSAESSSQSAALGYAADDLASLPEGADLGLGCGNPLGMLELREGETVVDLGSGGGIDCFLAAKRVGPEGRVIGVDMTPEMIALARRNAEHASAGNVEFRLGEIEHLPVADEIADAIISNCVVNLVPDKAQVFRDAFRVLRPGGRLSVSDIVLLGEVPLAIRDSVEAYVACLAGAVLLDDYLRMIADAGFTDVRVTSERTFDADDVVANDLVEEFQRHTGASNAELRQAAAVFESVRVSARKPA